MAVDPLWANRLSILPFDGSIADGKGTVWAAVGGSPAYVAGPFAGGQVLGGMVAGSYLQAPTTAPANFGTNPVAFEFWFKGSAAAGKSPYVIFSSVSSAGNQGVRVSVIADSGDAAGAVAIEVPGLSGRVTGPTTMSLCDGAWHYVQVIRNGTTVTMRAGVIGNANTTSYATPASGGFNYSGSGFALPCVGQDPFVTTYSPLDGVALRTTTGTPVATLSTAVPTAPFPMVAPVILNVTPAAYVIARPTVQMGFARKLNVTPAAYAVAAPSVQMGLATTLSVTPAAYAIAAPAVALGLGLGLSVSPTAYAVGTPDVSLTLTSSGIAYTLDVAPSAYAVAAPSARLSIGYGLGVLPANYTVLPADVSLGRGLNLNASPAAYAIAPTAALMSIGYGLGVLPAAYVVKSPAASLARGLALGVQPATYDIGQVNVSMGLSRVLSVTPATYDIDALPVSLTLGRPYAPTQWVYWTEPAENRTYTVPAENRQFDIPGENRYFKVVKP